MLKKERKKKIIALICVFSAIFLIEQTNANTFPDKVKGASAQVAQAKPSGTEIAHQNILLAKTVMTGTKENLEKNPEKRILFLPKGIKIYTQKNETTPSPMHLVEAARVQVLPEKYSGSFVVVSHFATDRLGQTWVRGLYEDGETTPWILSSDLPIFKYAKNLKQAKDKPNESYLTIDNASSANISVEHVKDFHREKDVPLLPNETYEVQKVWTVSEELPKTYYLVNNLQENTIAGTFSSDEVLITSPSIDTVETNLTIHPDYIFAPVQENQQFHLIHKKQTKLVTDLTNYAITGVKVTAKKGKVRYFQIEKDGHPYLVKENPNVRQTYYSKVIQTKKVKATVQAAKDVHITKEVPGSRGISSTPTQISKGTYLAVHRISKAKLQNGDIKTFYEVYDYQNKKLGLLDKQDAKWVNFKTFDYVAKKKDTFESLAKRFAVPVQDLKEYNPEIDLISQVTYKSALEELEQNNLFQEKQEDNAKQTPSQEKQYLPEGVKIFFYARENIEKLSENVEYLVKVASKLELEETPENYKVLAQMLEAKSQEFLTSSKLVAQLGYLIPYIQSRELLPSVAFAQAIIESADGASGLSVSDNNLFGYKGTYNGKGTEYPTKEFVKGKYITIRATFRKYDTLEESVKDYLDLLEANYGVKGIKDYVAYIKKVKAGGYATSPVYVKTLVDTVKLYDLDKLDKVDFTANIKDWYVTME